MPGAGTLRRPGREPLAGGCGAPTGAGHVCAYICIYTLIYNNNNNDDNDNANANTNTNTNTNANTYTNSACGGRPNFELCYIIIIISSSSSSSSSSSIQFYFIVYFIICLSSIEQQAYVLILHDMHLIRYCQITIIRGLILYTAPLNLVLGPEHSSLPLFPSSR